MVMSLVVKNSPLFLAVELINSKKELELYEEQNKEKFYSFKVDYSLLNIMRRTRFLFHNLKIKSEFQKSHYCK